MFIGHFAVGFAAKRAVPRVPLGVLFVAVQLADIIWPFLLAAGIEQVRIDPGNTAFTPLDFASYPYSHSFLLVVVWGVVFGYLYMTISRANVRVFATIAALVASHWILDFATHRPDLPVVPGGEKFGLGLWNSVPATLVVETGLFAAGVAIYARATRARDGIGQWGLAGLVLLLVVAYAANVGGGAPPSVTAIWMLGLIGFALIVALAEWVDRHREPSQAPTRIGPSGGPQRAALQE